MHLPRALHHVLDFCYPGVCVSCDASSPGSSPLCDECRANLDTLAAAPACDRCARPLATLRSPCPYCMGRGIYPFDRIIRLGVFEDPLKHLIHQMKYHKHWSLGEYLAERLVGREHAKGLLTHTDVLVPVPLYIWHHVSRGYNQADVIARRIGKLCSIPVAHAARRVRNTPSQAQIHSHEKRLANVRNAFALRRARSIRGKHVLLVDDVMTSAGTLQAVGRVLKSAKPASLCALVLAVADPKRRGFEVV